MLTKTFGSDNFSGAHPDILKAVIEANQGHQVAYGEDSITQQAEEKFKVHFGDDIKVFFVFNGTAANVLSMQAAVRSYNAIICSDYAHAFMDECGAVEKFTGSQMIIIPSKDGKIYPEQLTSLLFDIGDEHRAQPKLITITQPTEYGVLYTQEEIKSMANFAHKHNMILHMDGARLCNAAAALECELADLTKNAGVDILSFGGTKNGMMFGEAIVFFNTKLARDFKFIRKQGMQLGSKMRYISAQFIPFLSNDLWKNNANNANKMAKKLAGKIKKFPQITITQQVDVNMIFAKLPRKVIDRLRQKTRFYIVNDEQNIIRWMTSYDTSEEDVNQFVQLIEQEMDTI